VTAARAIAVAPTAGFRNAAWTSDNLPSDVRTTVRPLRTSDGAATNGFLYARGGERTVVCIMHPREFLATHYLIPHILAAGCAAWTQASRMVGNDLRLEHEIVLHDVAAALIWLREAGFERTVLLGNSGGAGLYSFYNQQALLAPERRIGRTPGGRPTRLEKASLPQADGIILVSPHPGQGKLLMNCIDPAVVDEADPFATDAALDFIEPRNGFNEPPVSSNYAPEFVERYRAGQRARVERLDKHARALIEQRMAARTRAKTSGSRADRIAGSFTPIMIIWRTDADLRCYDLSLDPSDRRYGSVWSADPYASNFGSVGFARQCTPESWLSTWSGISSNASLERTGSSMGQPTLIIGYTGDNTVFPADVSAIAYLIPATDKQMEWFKGDHHGQPLAQGEAPGRDGAGMRIAHWLRERFPVLPAV
jgi:pimeloyl-ACP methyl ester carboxylesterase